MPLEWVFPGADDVQKQRALDAALKVFADHRIQPEVAAVARMEMQAFWDRGERGPKPHPDAAKAALVFVEAQNAAIKATGALPDALERGYIRADITDESFASYYLRESEVLNWVDPDAASPSSN